MVTTAKLAGHLSIVGRSMDISAEFGANATTLNGTLAGPISLSDLLNELLAKVNVTLPGTFPAVTFEGTNALTVTIDLLSKRFLATGTLTVGNSPPLMGQIALSGGSLDFVSLQINSPISISDLLEHNFPGVDWGDLLPITLCPLSANQPMRMYYALANYPKPPAAAQYKKGFNIDQTAIKVGDFDADVTLNFDSGKITVAGQMHNPIDLSDGGFLIISGPQFQGSPLVSVSTADRQFALSASFTFLGSKFGSALLAVGKLTGTNDCRLAGDLKYDGTIGPFSNPELAFTWSKTSGFRVTNWQPPDTIDNPFDLLSKIKEYAASKNCTGIGSDIFQNQIVVGTKFHLKPGFKSGAGLKLLLNGSYDVTVNGNVVVNVDFPIDSGSDSFMEIDIPKGFIFDRIGEMITDNLIGNAFRLVAALVENPTKSGLFFAAVAGPTLLGRFVDQFTCIKTSLSAPPPVFPPPVLLPSGGTSYLDAPRITGAVTVGEFAKVIWSSVSASGYYQLQLVRADNTVVSGPLNSIGNSAVITIPDGMDPATLFSKVRAVSTQSSMGTSPWSSRSTLAQVSAPQGLLLAYDDISKSMTATWFALAGATEYIVQVVTSSGSFPFKNAPAAFHTANTAISVRLSTDDVVGPFNLQVSAVVLGVQGPWQNLDATLPAIPTGLTVNYNSGPDMSDPSQGMTAQWDPVSGAETYEMQVIFGDSVTTPAQVVTGIHVTEVPFKVPGNPQAGGYSVRVRSRSAMLPSAWSDLIYAFFKRPAPMIVGITLSERQVTFTRDTVGGFGALIRIVDANGAPVSNNPEVDTLVISSLNSSVTVDIPEDYPAGIWHAQIMAFGGPTVLSSDWSGTSPARFEILSAPAVQTANYAKLLNVQWTQVAGNQGYIVRVTGPLNLQVDIPVGQNQTSLQTAIPQMQDIPGKYFCCVKAIALPGSTTMDSPWSAIQGFPVNVKHVTPDVLTLKYSNVHISATWKRVADAVSYEYELINSNGDSFGVVTCPGPDTTSCSNWFWDPAYTPTYNATVTAIDANQNRYVGQPLIINQLEQVTILSCSVNGNNVTVNWREVPFADDYQIRFYCAAGVREWQSVGNVTSAIIEVGLAQQRDLEVWVSAGVTDGSAIPNIAGKMKVWHWK